jgi:DNA-binding response OmpR family regulator
VLLVEDNGDAREMLRTMLEDARHVVYDAVDFEHHLVKPIDRDRLIGPLSDMAEVLRPSP